MPSLPPLSCPSFCLVCPVPIILFPPFLPPRCLSPPRLPFLPLLPSSSFASRACCSGHAQARDRCRRFVRNQGSPNNSRMTFDNLSVAADIQKLTGM